MPMFHTPKPRQFAYKPRFYNPEWERWEALKAEHRMRQEAASGEPAAADAKWNEAGLESETVSSEDLAYYQARVRQLEQRHQREKLGWKDLFRKREKPTFNYQPRFGGSESQPESTGNQLPAGLRRRGVNIRRRFDVSDTEYMKPVPATRIMLYAMLVCLLLYWIIF